MIHISLSVLNRTHWWYSCLLFDALAAGLARLPPRSSPVLGDIHLVWLLVRHAWTINPPFSPVDVVDGRGLLSGPVGETSENYKLRRNCSNTMWLVIILLNIYILYYIFMVTSMNSNTQILSQRLNPLKMTQRGRNASGLSPYFSAWSLYNTCASFICVISCSTALILTITVKSH